MFLPAGLTGRWFPGFHEQIFNQLGRLHLVQGFYAHTEELLGQIFGYLLRDAGVLVDDAKDESLLTVGTVPGITDRFCLRMLSVAVLTTITVDLVGASVVLSMVTVPVGLRMAIGLRDEPGLLDFLIDAVLQKCVKLLHFDFDLGDVTEFDFNGSAEAVAAVLGQAEFFAVVGAEFDGHGVCCVMVVG